MGSQRAGHDLGTKQWQTVWEKNGGVVLSILLYPFILPSCARERRKSSCFLIQACWLTEWKPLPCTTWAWVLALSLTSCVTLGRLLNFDLNFIISEVRIIIVTTRRVVMKIKWVNYVKRLEPKRIHSNHCTVLGIIFLLGISNCINKKDEGVNYVLTPNSKHKIAELKWIDMVHSLIIKCNLLLAP